MKTGLNKEILRLSIPSILANLTVPLVGFVDTAVAGHIPGEALPSGTLVGAAAFIGAISVGAMLFNLLYWNFGFLRTGTGGLTAQAYGRSDDHACATMLFRALGLSIAISGIILILQWPFVKLVMLCVHASPEVEWLAEQYFFARVWAAPATLSLMAFSGWFVGMQDSMSSMWKDLIINGVNIVASIFLALGAGSWSGMGFVGVAWGTVVAQYSGLAFCVAVCLLKYRKVLGTFVAREFSEIFRWERIRGFFKMNLDLFGRSVFFTSIYIGYTVIAARYGDIYLACSSIIMQILLIFSFFTDGFAYAGEALAGRFIGERNITMLRRAVRLDFFWSMGIGLLFIGIYIAFGEPLIGLLTDDAAVVDACAQFIPWLAMMPPLGCAAFFWDGIFLGATASKGLRDALMWAAIAFFGVWVVGNTLLHPSGATALHLLLGAYFAHLVARTIVLTARYRKDVLGKLLTLTHETKLN